eukprot:scaffold3566_cov90-Skeletonema_dohrnii-CCMP3373.AAC.3
MQHLSKQGFHRLPDAGVVNWQSSSGVPMIVSTITKVIPLSPDFTFKYSVEEFETGFSINACLFVQYVTRSLNIMRFLSV